MASPSSTLFSIALTTLLAACAGRTAAWEQDPSAGASSDGAPAAGESDAAMEAWKQRTSPDKIREAIGIWEKAVGCTPGEGDPEDRCSGLATGPDMVEPLSMLTRAHYFLADGYLRADKKAYLATMDAAVFYGERALVSASPEFDEKMRNKGKFYEAVKLVGPEGVPAMYWYAAALGKWAKKEGIAVLIGQKDNVKATMERVLELNPDFFHGAPNRYFGAFYAVAPKAFGGDLEQSKKNYDISLEKAPYYIGTKVLMADEDNLFHKQDDVESFEKILNEVIATPDSEIPEDLWPEAAVERQKAKELLEMKDDLF